MVRYIPFLLCLLACSDQKDTQTDNLKVQAGSVAKNPEVKNSFAWTGLINNKIPVFLHYSIEGEIVAGEIYYLNTKAGKPIQIIGAIEEDSSYRLLEFEPGGNISGILEGVPSGDAFSGRWFSPKTRKEFSLNLKTKDTVVQSINLSPALNDIFGRYHYQYSEAGYHGDLEVNKLDGDKISFSIYSVTSDPARNLAEVPLDTVKLTGNSFTYTIPESDSCEFKVTFYRGFAAVSYTRGYCNGQFGMNATVDGIFLKTVK